MNGLTGLTGKVIADRFEFGECIGKGGFGSVYRGFDRLRESKVAIKVLDQLRPTSMSRFKNEFRQLASINHPNLVQLFEFFTFDSLWFFTMELIEGNNLLESLKTGSAENLPNSEVESVATLDTAEFFRQVGDIAESTVVVDPSANFSAIFIHEKLENYILQLVEGIAYLHNSNKLHCDLKPGNILISDDRVVILDFGMVQEATHSVDTYAGTPLFMSPEQARGMPASTASDWYALGVMLYIILTNKIPILDETPVQIFNKRRVATAPKPDEFPLSAPAKLVELCIRLLNPEPEGRPDGRMILRYFGKENSSQKHISQSMTKIFVGRHRELEVLKNALEQTTTTQSPQFLHIYGAQGIGKTALIDHFVFTEKEGDEIHTFKSTCHSYESISYKVFDAIVMQITHFLKQNKGKQGDKIPGEAALFSLFPVLGRLNRFRNRQVPPGGIAGRDRQVAFEAFAQLLNNFAKKRTLVLVLENLQWADEDSLDLLKVLLNHLVGPIFIISTSTEKTSNRGTCISLLQNQVNQQNLRINTLSLAESEKLTSLLVHSVHEEGIQLIAKESKGNPMFIEWFADLPTSEVTTEINQDMLLNNQLGKLNDSAIRYLQIIAVSKFPISRRHVKTIAKMEASELSIYSELRNKKFVKEHLSHGDNYVAMFNDETRQIVLSTLDESEAVEIHRQLADLLEAHSNDFERIAYHFEQSSRRRTASKYYQRASHASLIIFGLRHALRNIKAALDAFDWTAVEKSKLIEQQAVILSKMDRYLEAAECFEEAAGLAGSPETLRLKLKYGASLLRAGDEEKGEEAVRGVLTLLGVRSPIFPQRQTKRMLATELKPLNLSGEQNIEDKLRIDGTWILASLLWLKKKKQSEYFLALNRKLAYQFGNRAQVSRTLSLSMINQSMSGESSPVVSAIGKKGIQSLSSNEFDFLPHTTALCMFFETKFANSVEFFEKNDPMYFRGLNGNVFFYLHSLLLTGAIEKYASFYPDYVNRISAERQMARSTAILARYLPWLVTNQPHTGLEEVSKVHSVREAREFNILDFWSFYARVTTLLYLGEPKNAVSSFKERLPFFGKFRHQWTRSKTEFINSNKFMRITMLDLEIRTKFAFALSQNRIPRAQRLIKKLKNEKVDYSNILTEIHLGQLDLFHLRVDDAIKKFRSIEESSSRLGLRLFTSLAKISIARAQKDLDSLAGEYDHLRTQGVREPETFVRAFLVDFTQYSPRISKGLQN